MSIHIQELLDNFEKAYIIDVRDEDRAGGHIRGSVNVPSGSFDPTSIDLPRDRIIVVHCMFSQERGPRCADLLRTYLSNLGEPGPEIQVLTGGFQGAVHYLRRERPDLLEEYDPEVWEDPPETDVFSDGDLSDYISDEEVDEDTA